MRNHIAGLPRNEPVQIREIALTGTTAEKRRRAVLARQAGGIADGGRPARRTQ